MARVWKSAKSSSTCDDVMGVEMEHSAGAIARTIVEDWVEKIGGAMNGTGSTKSIFCWSTAGRMMLVECCGKDI